MQTREEIYAKKLQALIKEPTISTYFQKDLSAFRHCQETMRGLFPAVFTTCEVEDFDGSLLLRWRGKSSGDGTMFMNHYDVVPAEGEWKYPPFSGTIEGGKIWGRGALDTKGGLMCMLQSAEELIESGYIPEHDIYFEMACTEECDSTGADKISNELLSRGIRFRYTIDEGGMILHDPIGMSDGDYAMIGVGEKGCTGLKFVTTSKGGHASTPTTNTPLVRLGKLMADVDSHRYFKKKLNPITKEMFRRMAGDMKGILAFIFKHPTFFTPLLKLVLPMVSPTARAMLMTTVAFTQARGSEAFNSMPQEAYIGADMRSSHHQGVNESLAKLEKIAKKYNTKVIVTDPGIDSGVADFRAEPFRELEQAIAEVYAGVKSAPYITNTASDSRFMSRVSDNCLRFTPFFISDDQLAGIHGIDENVDIATLPKAVDIYKKLMEKC